MEITKTQELLSELSKDLDKDAVQKTDKRETKKGYDTTGYGYQWIVDRFNNVLGEKWGFDFEIINEKQGTYKSGKPYIEITSKVTIWVNDKESGRSCVGGHTSNNYADALKGAITNGFKKTAAFWGVGSKAFRGMIDDDNSIPDQEDQKQEKLKPSEEAMLDLKKVSHTKKREMLLLQIKEVIKSGSFAEKEIKAASTECAKAKSLADLNAILVKYQSELNKRNKDITKKAAAVFGGETIENFKDDIPGETNQKDLDIF